MRTGWSLIENPFLLSTRRNYAKMYSISSYTYGVLKKHSSDPFYLVLYNDFKPIWENYEVLYTKWKAHSGFSSAGTMSFKDLLKKLSNSLISNWHVRIQAVYAKDTPEYLSLLPSGTKHFHNGRRQVRINAVKNLITAIGTDANLASLKIEVEAFYAELTDVRTQQVGKMSNKKDFSGETEKARIKLAVAMMGLYGSLVARYPDHLEKVETFFDLETIRDKRQKTFTRKLKPHQSKTVVKRTLLPTDELKLQNTGTDDLLVCVCQGKKQICTTGFVLPASTIKTIAANLLGNVAELKYITITNTSEFEGHCVITLL